MLQAFGSDVHKKVFDELSREWRTEKELVGLLETMPAFTGALPF